MCTVHPMNFLPELYIVLQDPVFICEIYQIFISVHVNYFSFMPFCIGWVDNFDKITLSCTFKKIEANFCFSIFGKNLKIQNGRHFWEEENFLKIAKSTFLRYPVGRKFHRNNSILHS